MQTKHSRPRKKKNLRKMWYQFLIDRDGQQCKICGRTPPDVYLEIDHCDGDKNNNADDGSNYQLLCRSDNRSKNPRGKGKKKKVMVATVGAVSDKFHSSEIMLNRKNEPAFRHWLFATMKSRGKMTVNEVIFEGAESVNCSPYTIRTAYLPKVTSRAGIYRQYPDEAAGVNMVTFRDAKALGINVDDYFVDEPHEEIRE
jgi:hypothetical protein